MTVLMILLNKWLELRDSVANLLKALLDDCNKLTFFNTTSFQTNSSVKSSRMQSQVIAALNDSADKLMKLQSERIANLNDIANYMINHLEVKSSDYMMILLSEIRQQQFLELSVADEVVQSSLNGNHYYLT